jgi:aspartyl-tRNA(Asn)/glutamyl-tRNA(Gln) amidotransferase subunit A
VSALPTIAGLAADLAAGRTTAEALAEAALAHIEDPAGEGARAFITHDRGSVLAQARASDLMRAAGHVTSPLAGVPVSLKDLFDIAGEVTTAGSVVLKDAPPAVADAPVVARLRAAGAVLIGRTNMTEFAFSGIGMNPHYGTPGNPAERARVPGGSTSGGAVSVVDGMAVSAIGSDTGGSVRIPSAFCGLTGFKPTARRVPIDGVHPLSHSLDSVGPLAASVACCALLDATMAAEPYRAPAPRAAKRMRFGVVKNYVMDGVDHAVNRAYQAALSKLSAAGVVLEDIAIPALDQIPAVHARGALAAAECFAAHRDIMATDAARCDPRVASRIAAGAKMTAADYIDLLAARRRLCAESAAVTAQFDAVLLPTVAVVAPRMADLADDDEYHRQNLLILRNTVVGNFLDRCAVSLPIHHPGDLPVGLMLMGESNADKGLLDIAAGVEALLAA